MGRELKLGPEWLRLLSLSAATEKLGVEFDRSGLHGGLAIFTIPHKCSKFFNSKLIEFPNYVNYNPL